MVLKDIWQQLRTRLGDPAADDGGDPERDVEFAAAALMIEMCEADLKTAPSELDAVARALEQEFALPRARVEELIGQARARSRREVSYYPHVEVVNELCGVEEKERIVECLWRIAAADGRVDKYEEHYLRRLCELLHLPHRLFMQTKHRVLDR